MTTVYWGGSIPKSKLKTMKNKRNRKEDEERQIKKHIKTMKNNNI